MMSATDRMLRGYAKNGVLPLSKLKRINYPMLLYVLSNFEKIEGRLKHQDIEILDDLVSLAKLEKLKLYIKYHYGRVVNLSQLRKECRTVYNYLSEIGNPEETLTNLGFFIIYDSKTSVHSLLDTLRNIADAQGNIAYLGKGIYNRVYYRATRHDSTVKDYLANFGFNYIDNENFIDDIIKMKDEKKMSFSEIGKQLKLPKSTTYKLYRKGKSKK